MLAIKYENTFFNLNHLFFNLISSPTSYAKWIKVLEIEDEISFYIDF